MTITTPAPIESLPYATRQLMVVVDDAVAAAIRKAEAEAQQPNEEVDWTKVGDVAIQAIMGPAGKLALEAARGLVNAWARARQTGLPLLQAGLSEALRLKFPPGHPRQGVLYISHPAYASQYYSAADFHRVTFEHKFSEAVRLLAALGANNMRVEHVKGWSKEFSSRLTVALDESGAKGTATASGVRAAANSLLFEAKLGGIQEPKLPDGMVWYPHESTWRMLAEVRLEAGLEEFSLGVTYEDDFGVNASLKAAIEKVGIGVGGKFEAHESTIWRITGTFAPFRPK